MARKKVAPDSGRSGEGGGTRAGSYAADDSNYPSFVEQLNNLQLEIRDVQGDGNCLFRALGDQLDGSDKWHLQHRREACDYMLSNKEDFAPFVDDSTSFEEYVSELCHPGTYAGNDAIVAFARRHQLGVVIHQLNSAPWHIGDTAASKQLHLAYHNGEHYSSIRRLGDRSCHPANVFIKLDAPHVLDGAAAGGLWAANGTGSRIFGPVVEAKLLPRARPHKAAPLRL